MFPRIRTNPDESYTFSNKTVFPDTAYGLTHYMPIQKVIKVLPPGAPAPNVYTRTLKDKVYELTDHLGNVRAVVSDEKHATLAGGVPGAFVPDVVAGNNYYPGGSIMPGRSFNPGTYRYGGAGGQEMDNEISGVGNSYTAEYWQYDSRLMRRWNVDPLAHLREWVSPYNFVQNNPINRIDPTGALDHEYSVDKDGNLKRER